MTPYQNYFPNNPYMNQTQNPYMAQIQNLQQLQQTLQAPTTIHAIGNVVEGIKNVETMNIPMDGNMYYFPKADGTEIYGKQWLSNGTTRTIVFKPLLESGVDNSSTEQEKLKFEPLESLKQEIISQITLLNDKIDRLEKNFKGLKSRKEATDE